MEAVREILRKQSNKLTKCINTLVITTFLTLFLTLNYFVFNCKHYSQIEGCAMCTKCAPFTANIFVGKFEEKYIYPRIKTKSVLYLRYIHDIFLIYTGTIAELKLFCTSINQVHTIIKSEIESLNEKNPFLDILGYKNDSSTMQTKLY